MWSILSLLSTGCLVVGCLWLYRLRLRRNRKTSRVEYERIRQETIEFLAHLDALNQVRRNIWIGKKNNGD